MIIIDLNELTPLERSAVEHMAALETRAEGAPQMSAEQYVEMTLARALESWKTALVDARLPTLRPLAERYLNLTDEGRAEILARMDALDAPPEGTT